MYGRQSPDSTRARYRFILKKIDYTKRDGWHHAFFNGPRDQRMKRALHRGNAARSTCTSTAAVPGTSRCWAGRGSRGSTADTPYLDGVSVNFAALPGGKASGYNRGDTVVHEVGHWLGLFHTFEGGCRGDGDLVPDTAAEARAELLLPDHPGHLHDRHRARTRCATSWTTPWDSCMNMFSTGQVNRMDAAYFEYRL